MKVNIEKAVISGTTADLLERIDNVTKGFEQLKGELPTDVIRIEIDVEYADGGRVKLEGRA